MFGADLLVMRLPNGESSEDCVGLLVLLAVANFMVSDPFTERSFIKQANIFP